METREGKGARWEGGCSTHTCLFTLDGNLTLELPFYLYAERKDTTSSIPGARLGWVQDLAFGRAAYLLVLIAMSNIQSPPHPKALHSL